MPDQPLGLTELEAGVQAWGQEVMRHAFASAWTMQAPLRAPKPCPTCGQRTFTPAGDQPRSVDTVVGPVHLVRDRVHRTGCGHYLLERLDLTDQVVAIHAMSCQWEIAAQILHR